MSEHMSKEVFGDTVIPLPTLASILGEAILHMVEASCLIGAFPFGEPAGNWNDGFGQHCRIHVK